MTADCRFCGHTFQAHQHWRAGTDCSLCSDAQTQPCNRYRRPSLLAWLLGGAR